MGSFQTKVIQGRSVNKSALISSTGATLTVLVSHDGTIFVRHAKGVSICPPLLLSSVTNYRNYLLSFLTWNEATISITPRMTRKIAITWVTVTSDATGLLIITKPAIKVMIPMKIAQPRPA